MALFMSKLRISTYHFAALLLLCLLLVGSDEVIKVEGRMCQSPSNKFRGTCFRSSNCASVCQSEHFSDGYCAGLRRRCMCRRPC